MVCAKPKTQKIVVKTVILVSNDFKFKFIFKEENEGLFIGCQPSELHYSC